jgi:hypothetical protein
MDNDNQLYMLLGEIKAGVAAMHSRFDSLVADHKKLEETTDERLNAHSNRILRVERFQWMLLGAATFMSVAVPIVISLLT